MPEPKFCTDCKHAFRLPVSAKYLRCRQSEAPEEADATLAGQMRRGACGPDATLWEPIDG